MPTRAYQFGRLPPSSWPHEAEDEIIEQQTFWDQLVAIEHAYQASKYALWASLDPRIPADQVRESALAALIKISTVKPKRSARTPARVSRYRRLLPASMPL